MTTCPRPLMADPDINSDFSEFVRECHRVCNPRGIVDCGRYPDGCTLFVRAMIASAKEEAKEAQP